MQEGENAITGMNINGEVEGENEADKVDEIREEEDDQGRATHVLYDKETDEFNYKSLANAEPTTISPHELGLHPHLVYRWFLNACKRAPGQWLKVDEIIDLDGACTHKCSLFALALFTYFRVLMEMHSCRTDVHEQRHMEGPAEFRSINCVLSAILTTNAALCPPLLCMIHRPFTSTLI